MNNEQPGEGNEMTPAKARLENVLDGTKNFEGHHALTDQAHLWSLCKSKHYSFHLRRIPALDLSLRRHAATAEERSTDQREARESRACVPQI